MTVTCRVLKIARAPYDRWLACPVTPLELVEAYRANALFDTTRATRSSVTGCGPTRQPMPVR